MNSKYSKRIVTKNGPFRGFSIRGFQFSTIQHPMQKWKILVLCTTPLSISFYLFDTRKNTLKAISIHGKNRYSLDPSLPRLESHVLLKGTKTNTVIVIGATVDQKPDFLYGVIDAVKHRWTLLHIIAGGATVARMGMRKGIYALLRHYFPSQYFWHTKAAIVHRSHAENWIILVNTGLRGNNRDKTKTIVSIYELDETEYPNTRIARIPLEIDLEQYRYLMIQIPTVFRKFEEKDEEAIVFLFVLCGYSRPSVSIFEFSIVIRTCDDVNRSILYSMQKNPQHWIGDLFNEKANLKSRQLQLLLRQAEFAMTVGSDSRFLVIFCTTIIDPHNIFSPRCSKIVYYDRHFCHWNIADYILPQEGRERNFYTMMNGNKYAFIFNKVNEKMWQMRKVEIDASINWKLERVIWIGYHKNSSCYFAQLSKDIVFYMLQFLRNDLLWKVE